MMHEFAFGFPAENDKDSLYARLSDRQATKQSRADERRKRKVCHCAGSFRNGDKSFRLLG